MKARNYIGDTYGRLIVVGEEPRRNNRRYMNCTCSCGNTKITSLDCLRKGDTKSCGCLHLERSTTHGDSGTKLYRVWVNFHSRCNDPNQDSYKNYGGRGITVCTDWDTYPAFKEWAIAHGYAEGLTIDRKDNDGNYHPDNCRWVDLSIQNRNRRKLGSKSSAYTGVVWVATHSKWKAQIRVNSERKFLGYFDTELSAAIARDNYIVENDLQGYILNKTEEIVL